MSFSVVLWFLSFNKEIMNLNKLIKYTNQLMMPTMQALMKIKIYFKLVWDLNC